MACQCHIPLLHPCRKRFPCLPRVLTGVAFFPVGAARACDSDPTKLLPPVQRHFRGQTEQCAAGQFNSGGLRDKPPKYDLLLLHTVCVIDKSTFAGTLTHIIRLIVWLGYRLHNIMCIRQMLGEELSMRYGRTRREKACHAPSFFATH